MDDVQQSLKRQKSADGGYKNVVSQGKAPDFSRISSASAAHKANFGETAETDAARLAFREKQISYGKNTVGYDNYISLVPK